MQDNNTYVFLLYNAWPAYLTLVFIDVSLVLGSVNCELNAVYYVPGFNVLPWWRTCEVFQNDLCFLLVQKKARTSGGCRGTCSGEK